MKKTQILVIDDEDTIRAIVSRTLRKEGYELFFAENGVQGVELLKTIQPTVIVLDLQMPRMDGISFIKEINLQPDDPYAIIILTGHGNDAEMQECFSLGAHLFIKKPFGFTEFVCQVRRLVSLKRLEAENRVYRAQLEKSIVVQTNYINKLSQVLELSSSIIVITDSKGRATYTNEAYSRLTDITAPLLNEPPELLSKENLGQQLYDELWKSINEGQMFRGEFNYYITKEERECFLQAVVVPFKASAGEADNIFFILDDITEIKSAKIAEQKAIEANKEAVLAKECFSNNMSHELRTPLHIINSSLSLIDRSSLPEDKRKFYDFIKSASDNLHDLIVTILDYNLAKKNEINIYHRDINMRGCLAETVDDVKSEANDKGLGLYLDIASSIPETLSGDEYRLRQILSYLLNNAVKFTEKGKVTLHVEMQEQKEQQIFVNFEVHDTGIGIDESQKNKIFEEFSQVDQKTTRNHGGLGIGLTLVNYLVSSLNGTINLVSTPGKGSVFKVLLPFPVLSEEDIYKEPSSFLPKSGNCQAAIQY